MFFNRFVMYLPANVPLCLIMRVPLLSCLQVLQRVPLRAGVNSCLQVQP